MVHHQCCHPAKKSVSGDLEDSPSTVVFGDCSAAASATTYKRKSPKLFFLLLLSLFSFAIVVLPQLLHLSSTTFSLLYSAGGGIEDPPLSYVPPCSSPPNGTICCDRSSFRSDVCYMKGDVRTRPASSSVFLYAPNSDPVLAQGTHHRVLQSEKIKPYTRKWEAPTMDTIDELELVVENKAPDSLPKCDVHHTVPAVFFSTGGYTGNVYHEFNDGILPLYITSQHLNKEVVFVILEYHDWWITKYGDVVSRLSSYPVIDFSGDNRTHCFPEAIVGLRIHDELTVDPSLMQGGKKGIKDFRDMLNRAYRPRIESLLKEEEREMQLNAVESPLTPLSVILPTKPKLTILSRNGSRAILNQDRLIKLAEEIGFTVDVLRPDKTTELAKIYRSLNSSDVMIGVHGAAMTHFLFMRPGSVFIQVVPLGTDWAAETYYGEPSKKLGLKYIGYTIHPKESSLYKEYERSDPVLMDPNSVTKKGWEYTKKIYLDGQNVVLDLRRFRKRLVRAYQHANAARTRLRRSGPGTSVA
ncbi:hypothetical protein MLD38_004462 [Melastoma candidum]|uniref:Uncharacterized protein n=1 Tax=Melastoma candidum TaxID=119954 RepID=A0ACB9S585_9MYRT|nr:hypothetical protein MLD38_004462 [Melastoma candidum]